MAADFQNTRIEFGDSLLVAGAGRTLKNCTRTRRSWFWKHRLKWTEAPSHGQGLMPLAIVLLGMLVMMVTGVTSTLSACLIAAMAMILTGCVKLRGGVPAH